ncbi:MAG: PrsW family glutamic-type intramembrane protease [Parcubacteria group bacterium]|jgi:uncharacterized membrane protein (UPF0136 family)
MNILKSFFLGILGALGALVLEIITLSSPTSMLTDTETISREITSFGYFFFLAIIIEEFLKYLLVYKAIAKTNAGKNIVLNSLFFGFGFSMLEMFLIYWSCQNGSPLDLIGLSGIVIIHISTATLMGYFISKNTVNFISGLFFGFIPAFLIHSAYNILKISEIARQKEITIILLASLIFLDIFLLVKSKIAYNIESI